MSFDMQRMPSEPPTGEKLSFYRWAIAYFLLSLCFGFAGWTLVFQHRGWLGFVSLVGCMICNFNANKNFEQYRRHQEIDDE